MELSDLNFKQALIVLTKPTMRIEILNFLKEQEIDIGIKFVNSYIEGAKMIQTLEHDPYDFIVVDRDVSNSKSKDFLDYAGSNNKTTRILAFSKEDKISYFK